MGLWGAPWRSWVGLVGFGSVLGGLGAVLGRSWGGLGAVLGRSWGVQGSRWEIGEGSRRIGEDRGTVDEDRAEGWGVPGKGLG